MLPPLSNQSVPATYLTLVSNGAAQIAGRYSLTLGTTVLSHSVISPALSELITGRARVDTSSQFWMTTGLMALTSLGVILGTLPVGHLIQRPDLAAERKFSFRTIASAVFDLSLATISQVGVAVIYGQNPWTAFGNGMMRGATRGFPISLIYKQWGDRPLRATVYRQIANMVLMVNATTLTSVFSQPEYKRALGPWTNLATMAEIGVVSGVFWLLLSSSLASKVLGPAAHVEKTAGS